MCKKGFTLVEVLVSVMIIAILVTLATPMYQRAVEKSRVAEVSMGLKQLDSSKARMALWNLGTSNLHLSVSQLDVQAPPSGEFYYSLWPTGFYSAVCARRIKGKNTGTIFLYLGEAAEEACDCSVTQTGICKEYCDHGTKLFCKGTGCDDYGLNSYDAVGNCN